MIDRDMIFVDVETLNAVFYTYGKFSAALNFSSAIGRLLELISSRKPGYDVYLVMKPKKPGTGDIIIDELSMTGLPFTANSVELRSIQNIFIKLHGVNNVYLCNWAHNYITCARVDSFESVFYYGSSVVKLVAENRMVKSVEFFNSQKHFHDSGNEEYSGYGDVGLLDTDGLSALHPELHAVNAPQLTVLAPLIHSYKAAMKLDLVEYVLPEYRVPPEDSAPNDLQEKAELPKATPPKKLTAQKSDPPKTAKRKIDPQPVVVPKRRSKLSNVAKVFTAASLCLAFLLGVSLRINVLASGHPVQSGVFYSEKDALINSIRALSTYYTTADGSVQSLADRYAYVAGNDIGVSVVGFSHTANETTFRCACASNSMLAAFLDYVGQKYVVTQTAELGEAESNGSTVYQFEISLME